MVSDLDIGSRFKPPTSQKQSPVSPSATDWICPSCSRNLAQSSIIYRDQCKDCTSEYTGQTSMKLATRTSERRAAKRNSNVKVSLMETHFAETKTFTHANSWTARLFKEAWHSNKNSINNLPQGAIFRRSIMTVGGELTSIYSQHCISLSRVLVTVFSNKPMA